jgi:hypothetical protein
MSIKKVIVHEMKEMALVSLYFFIAFGFLVLVKMIKLAQNNIEFYSVALQFRRLIKLQFVC